MIKTPLGSVELGMQYGKIVWCGFASVGSGASDAAGDAGTSGAAGASEADRAQKDTQMCPAEGKSAAREQNCRLVCPEPEERMPEAAASARAVASCICALRCSRRLFSRAVRVMTPA